MQFVLMLMPPAFACTLPVGDEDSVWQTLYLCNVQANQNGAHTERFSSKMFDTLKRCNVEYEHDQNGLLRVKLARDATRSCLTLEAKTKEEVEAEVVLALRAMAAAAEPAANP